MSRHMESRHGLTYSKLIDVCVNDLMKSYAESGDAKQLRVDIHEFIKMTQYKNNKGLLLRRIEEIIAEKTEKRRRQLQSAERFSQIILHD